MSDPVQEALDCAADDGMDRRHYATIRAAIEQLRAEVARLGEELDVANTALGQAATDCVEQSFRAEEAEAEAAQLRAEKEAAERRLHCLADHLCGDGPTPEMADAMVNGSDVQLFAAIDKAVRLLVVEGGENG